MKRSPVPSCMFVLFVSLIGAQPLAAQPTEPPVAKKMPQSLTAHGHTRVDEYYWLRERENQEVLDYLNAENDYMESRLAPTRGLQSKLAEETQARIKQSDTSVPYTERGYLYFRRTEDGKQYPIYCRAPADDPGDVRILLDVNRVAEGFDFCSIRNLTVSPNNRYLAFAIDTVGRRKYRIHFYDLETGEHLDSNDIPVSTPNIVWAEDNKTLLYTIQDPQTLRSHKIFRHELGTDPAADVLVYEEKDDEFWCGVAKSRSRKYLLISSSQTLSTETRYLPADQPAEEPSVFLPREENHEYSVDHLGDAFYIRTNWDATNFRLMRTPEHRVAKSEWVDVVPHRKDAYLGDYQLFDGWLAVSQKEGGQTKLRFRKWGDSQWQDLDFGEPCYQASFGYSPESDTKQLRYNFSSLKTPDSVFEFDMENGTRQLLKQDEILGGFDPRDYVTRFLWAKARDGVAVPISLIHHKETAIDGTAPCLIYGYGSYGASMSASFSSSRFNLIDRGFVYAIAHIRGGQELGREWYEDGKLLRKKNTFSDFVDCTKFLLAEKYADKDRVFARGGSAGGLLMGAVVNMAPDLYQGIVADVPFVDVVTTMLDESIPLTTGEYDEWGNPNEPKYYAYMLSYSPYDRVERKDYPNMLVTTGLHDSQVQYWEPAKWVARLRDRKTDDNMLVLKTNMSAGHGGASGRYDRYKEIALRHAFILHHAGIEE